MKIAIVGCGATGSVYGGLLADAGHEVWAVDLWREHVEAILAKGLRIEGASGERTVRLSATTRSVDVGRCDLVVIGTKVGDVTAAAESARPLLRDDTLVLSIQNGLGGQQRAASVLGRERVAVGVIGGFGASMRAPGHVHHNGMETVRMGHFEGPVSARLEAVADAFRSAGFPVTCYDDLDRLIWEKLVFNAAVSGPCAVTGRTIADLMGDEDAAAVALRCAREADAVARAKGVALGFEDVETYVRDFAARIPDARPSMLLDLMAGRATEIDAINGAIPDVAREVDLEAPCNATVAALVRARERALGVR